jgi:hypothetical protein
MNGIIFAPQFDRPPHANNPDSPGACTSDSCPVAPIAPHDATGAFQPGAKIFREVHALPDPIIFNNHQSNKKCRDAILHEILTAEGGNDKEFSGMLDVVAYFGHGTQHSLPSAGFHESDIPDLASAISSKAKSPLTVILYACSAAALHGFASKLASALSSENVTVFGHTTAGHTFSNPYVRSYPGGDWVIGPHDKLWKKWRAVLEDSRLDPFNNNRLWAEFPFMSDAELHVALHAFPDLFGRWEVPGDGGPFDYLFFPDHSAFFTVSGEKRPNFIPGWWYVTEDGVKVVWPGDLIEVLPPPLNTHKQTVRAQDGSYTVTAKRKDKNRLKMRDKKKLGLTQP